jgi:aspartyl-tRNA(Asn)/glutamyl-tRNA(Gln) amidotransferase subunit A
MLSFSEFANKPPSRRGTVVDLVKSILRKIELSGSNSFLYLNSDAIIDAAESDRRFDSGCPRPLEGMLVAVKDNISVRDMPITCGSRMLENFTAQFDATCVKRLKENGAIIIGKTNLDEFAMGSSGERSYFGKIRNFKFPDRKSGGSSAGSASAVAEGLCHIALGSDTGGSVRIPAAWCGAIGYKPAYGAISRYGLTAFASSLDCVGIIGSNASDIRLAYTIMAGFDKNDQTSIKEPPVFGYKNFPKKFAMLSEKSLKGCEGEIIKNYQQQAAYFKNSGFEIQEIELKYLDYWVPVYQVISSAEAAANLARYDGTRYGYRSPAGDNPREIAINSRTEGIRG